MAYNYYGRFPTIDFDSRTLTDITRRLQLELLSKENIVGFEKYNIKDGETIEGLAFKYYGDAGYHWLIIIANEIIDPYYGWPLSDDTLKKYVSYKYGAGNEYSTHHYEPSAYSDLPEGTILDTSIDAGQRIAVTNYEYETKTNENKRLIRLFKKQFISGLVNEFQTKIRL